MTQDSAAESKDVLACLSSFSDDVWSGPKSDEEYEWWYFDAISDDGRDSIVIAFFDNFVFSPRYNGKCAGRAASTESGIPAVVFVLYRDGKPVCKITNEYENARFSASTESPVCEIGRNRFEYGSAPYGNGYFVTIDMPLGERRRIRAKFEWLSIEYDMGTRKSTGFTKGIHHWNIVAPRSDVSGRVTIIDSKGKRHPTKFRGTGYHDHHRDSRWLAASISEWSRGRVHLPYATAVYYDFVEEASLQRSTRLFFVEDDRIEADHARIVEPVEFRRNTYGIKYPREFRLVSENGQLLVKQSQIVENSIYYLRFLSEIHVDHHKYHGEAWGITEYLKPKHLRNRWLNFLTGMNISRNG
ncbi:MAG: hypothetical protein R2684_06720 [Pyrinomonadaceae bacterium]